MTVYESPAVALYCSRTRPSSSSIRRAPRALAINRTRSTKAREAPPPSFSTRRNLRRRVPGGGKKELGFGKLLTVFLERPGTLCGGGRDGRELDHVDGGAREFALFSDIRRDGLDVELAGDLGDAVAARGVAERVAQLRHRGSRAQVSRVQVRLRDEEVVVRRTGFEELLRRLEDSGA